MIFHEKQVVEPYLVIVVFIYAEIVVDHLLPELSESSVLWQILLYEQSYIMYEEARTNRVENDTIYH